MLNISLLTCGLCGLWKIYTANGFASLKHKFVGYCFLRNFIIRGDVYLHVYIDLGVVFILRIFLIVGFL